MIFITYILTLTYFVYFLKSKRRLFHENFFTDENFFTKNCICIGTCCIIIDMVKLIISENEAGQRLDRFLRKYLRKASLGSIYKMIRKDVKLNGKRVREDTMLCSCDELSLYMKEERVKILTAPDKKKTARKQFKIIYEDNNILIVDKPWGLLTHGDSHEKKNTLANQVCGYLQECGEYDPAHERTFTPSPVNRLDRNTTGLVIFGKNSEALRKLTAVIRRRDGIEKYYMTIVCGCLKQPIVLEDRLVKDQGRNISQIANGNRGKDAVTYVAPVVSCKEFSLAEVRILTGRTHQIRTHLSHAGFPLAGDAKYGDRNVNAKLKKHGITTQLLHACKLKFADSADVIKELRGKTVEAPMPAEFLRVKELLISEK